MDRYAIIITTSRSCYFLCDEDGETTYFENPDDCEIWIEENQRGGHEYHIWDCAEACVYS